VVILLDSAVIAGFLDRDDALHPAADRRLRELAGRERLVASFISYAELLTGAGLGHHEPSAVRGFFADLVDVVHGVDGEIAERAAALRIAKRSLRMPDALILATADLRGTDLVLTADRRWPGVLGETPRIELLGAPGA
jgi:predicted nucleic acid-binding protein